MADVGRDRAHRALFGIEGQAVEALERPDIPGNLQRAARFLNSAIERDPRFALAFARLGEAYWATYQATSDPKWAADAAIATSKALTLDQQQPEVWTSLALSARL